VHVRRHRGMVHHHHAQMYLHLPNAAKEVCVQFGVCGCVLVLRHIGMVHHHRAHKHLHPAKPCNMKQKRCVCVWFGVCGCVWVCACAAS